jgi:hypothetical protein
MSWTLRTELMGSIARQMMSGDTVDVEGQSVPVSRTSTNRLRTIAFTMDRRKYQAIEQNPDKPSRWAKLARDGHNVVQFKDVETNRFIAVAVDGKIKLYGARHGTRKE